MPRLRRFEEHRFIGTRGDMRVYDCDDAEQFGILAARAEGEDLMGQNLISALAPDTLEEGRNRGFRPVGVRKFEEEPS